MKHILLISLFLPFAAVAEEGVYSLVIKDHRFQPAEITIPAGMKVKLLVENQDSTAEEFESHSLNREKIIAGKSKTTIFIGPLTPGRYTFEGEFNAKTAQGAIIAQ
ncbi:MAG TPA: cupredoxin domain-containing protein [Gallionellaceae bacterium]|nr:cupredoxin domain-containing protein [Gallionellaceae bacterium]